MTFTFRPAMRENVSLLIGLAGGTGSGKTYTAMRLAKGIAGDKPFAVIDTEAGRAKHYADRFRFDHGDLKPPFRPKAYEDAIVAADQAGYSVILVDSMSHEHAGEGGLLDWHEEELARMAGSDWKKREACNLAGWVPVKMAHKHMVNKLLQVRAHLILCFRAEPKIEIVRGADGKTEYRAKQSLTGLDGWIPVSEKSLPYELTASFLLLADKPGVPKPIKLQEQHKALFPLDRPITEASGAQLAAWARGEMRPDAQELADTARQDEAHDWLTLIGDARTVADLKTLNRNLKAAAPTLSPAAVATLRAAYTARLTIVSAEATHATEKNAGPRAAPAPGARPT